MTIRYPISLAAVVLAIPLSLVAQSAVDKTSSKADVTCIEDLQVPLYDGLAWIAQATGSFEASIMIGPGPARLTAVHGGPPVIAELLKAALAEATFSHRCDRRTLEIHFIYRLEGAPDNSPHNRIRVKRDDTFEIVARPPFPISPQPSSTSTGP